MLEVDKIRAAVSQRENYAPRLDEALDRPPQTFAELDALVNKVVDDEFRAVLRSRIGGQLPAIRAALDAEFDREGVFGDPAAAVSTVVRGLPIGDLDGFDRWDTLSNDARQNAISACIRFAISALPPARPAQGDTYQIAVEHPAVVNLKLHRQHNSGAPEPTAPAAPAAPVDPWDEIEDAASHAAAADGDNFYVRPVEDEDIQPVRPKRGRKPSVATGDAADLADVTMAAVRRLTTIEAMPQRNIATALGVSPSTVSKIVRELDAPAPRAFRDPVAAIGLRKAIGELVADLIEIAATLPEPEEENDE